MPRGDRRGPEGFGPRTGRGLGFCNGYESPGYTRGGGRGAGRGMGRGRGFAMGGGRGWGFNNDYYAARPVSDEEYKKILKEEHEALKHRMDELEKEMKE